MQLIRNWESVLIFKFVIPAFLACLAATVTAIISALLLVARPTTASDTFLRLTFLNRIFTLNYTLNITERYIVTHRG